MKAGIVIVADVYELDDQGTQVIASKSVFGPERDYDKVESRLKEFRTNAKLANSLGYTLIGTLAESFRISYAGSSSLY